MSNWLQTNFSIGAIGIGVLGFGLSARRRESSVPSATLLAVNSR